MHIQICNWQDHNPRNDYKSMPWFRMSSGIIRERKLRGVPLSTKWTLVCLLCLAAEENKSGELPYDLDWISDESKIDKESLVDAISFLEREGIIEISQKKRRSSRVREPIVTRTADDREPIVSRSLRTNETKRTNDPLREWDLGDPMAKVFENLMAFGAYARVFDREKERSTIEAHMQRVTLSLAEVEQITWELRCWADGPNGAKVKSPRGTLATFVKNYVERKAKAPPEPQQREQVPTFSSVEELDAYLARS